MSSVDVIRDAAQLLRASLVLTRSESGGAIEARHYARLSSKIRILEEEMDRLRNNIDHLDSDEEKADLENLMTELEDLVASLKNKGKAA